MLKKLLVISALLLLTISLSVVHLVDEDIELIQEEIKPEKKPVIIAECTPFPECILDAPSRLKNGEEFFVEVAAAD